MAHILGCFAGNFYTPASSGRIVFATGPGGVVGDWAMRRDGRRNGEERQPRPLASHPSSDGNGAIQEMIAEAFQISPNASPDRYFRESTRARNGHGRHDTHVSHQEELSRHETPHDPLGLEVHTRLKNLELRIAHLETVLFSPRHEERGTDQWSQSSYQNLIAIRLFVMYTQCPQTDIRT